MIDYSLLARAVELYDQVGYEQIEVPWIVSEAVSDITRPPWASQYVVDKDGKRKAFIGSGEQGFLYLICKGNLPGGRYQTVTPCMRNDTFDETHTKYFMKCELIQFGHFLDDERVLLESMVNDAHRTFIEMGASRDKLAIVIQPDKSFDIEYGGIEIGSYGIRECKFARWIYGTGLAEPRFSRMRKVIDGF